METVQINVSQVETPKDFNVRDARNYGDINSLAEQIKVDGQLTPILVGPATADGKYPLVAGFRRVTAIRKIARENGGDHPVLARIVSEKPAEQAWLNLVENLSRNDLTSYEHAKGFTRLNKDFGWSYKKIAERFGVRDDGETRVKGMSESNINNLISAFTKLAPECLEAWSKGYLGLEAAFKLKTYTPEEQVEMLPYVKGKSGAALLDAIEEYERGDDPSASSSDEPKKRRSKPGPQTLRRAIAWAKDNELEEVIAVLKWVIGSGGKKLKVSGVEFDPKAVEQDEDEDN